MLLFSSLSNKAAVDEARENGRELLKQYLVGQFCQSILKLKHESIQWIIVHIYISRYLTADKLVVWSSFQSGHVSCIAFRSKQRSPWRKNSLWDRRRRLSRAANYIKLSKSCRRSQPSFLKEHFWPLTYYIRIHQVFISEWWSDMQGFYRPHRTWRVISPPNFSHFSNFVLYAIPWL